MLPNHIDDACEEIDAALFSGDSLHEFESLDDLESYVDRWKRKIAETREFLIELEDEENES